MQRHIVWLHIQSLTDDDVPFIISDCIIFNGLTWCAMANEMMCVNAVAIVLVVRFFLLSSHFVAFSLMGLGFSNVFNMFEFVKFAPAIFTLLIPI